MTGESFIPVLPGLDPGIHVLPFASETKRVDGRVKLGHDG